MVILRDMWVNGAERTWTKAAGQLTDQPPVRRVLAGVFADLVWQETPAMIPETLAPSMMALCEAHDLPPLTAVAWGGNGLPGRIIGLEASYREGRARHYWLDQEGELLPLATDLWWEQ